MNKGVIAFFSALAGAAAGTGIVLKKSENTIDKMRSLSEKHLALFLLMNQWVKLRQQGKSLAEYFHKEGYKNIAIYGMSYVGDTLITELRNTDIHVAYGIDKDAKEIYTDVNVVTLRDALEHVDVVVVTAITYFDEIKEVLKDKVDCPIISLEDILYEI